MRLRDAGIVILVCALAVFLGQRSGYALPDRASVNLDIMLMLTPWGLLRNLLILPDSPLRPFYHVTTTRSGALDDAVLGVALLALLSCVAFLLHRFARQGERR